MTDQMFELVIRRATKQVWAKRKSRSMHVVKTAYPDVYHVTEEGYDYLMLMHHGVFKSAVMFIDGSDFHCMTLPEYQMQGHTYNLLTKAYLPIRFMTTDEVCCTAKDEPAIRLLKKIGFEQDRFYNSYVLLRDIFRKKFQSSGGIDL